MPTFFTMDIIMGSTHACPQGSYINRIDINTKTPIGIKNPVIVGYKVTCNDKRSTTFSEGPPGYFVPYTANVISPSGFVSAQASLLNDSKYFTSLLMSAPSGPLNRIGLYNPEDIPVVYPDEPGLITGVVFKNDRLLSWTRDPSLGPAIRPPTTPVDDPAPTVVPVMVNPTPSYVPPVSTVPSGTSTVIVSTPLTSQPVTALPVYSTPPTAGAIPVYSAPSSPSGTPVVIPSMPMDIAQPVDVPPAMSQVESGTLPETSEPSTLPPQPVVIVPVEPSTPLAATSTETSLDLSWLLLIIFAVIVALAVVYSAVGSARKGAGQTINYVK